MNLDKEIADAVAKEVALLTTPAVLHVLDLKAEQLGQKPTLDQIKAVVHAMVWMRHKLREKGT